MRKLLMLPLIAATAFQFSAIAFADTATPAASLTPAASPAPAASHAPEKNSLARTQTLALIGSAVVLAVLLLSDHGAAGCNNAGSDQLQSDARLRRPAPGFALRIPIR